MAFAMRCAAPMLGNHCDAQRMLTRRIELLVMLESDLRPYSAESVDKYVSRRTGSRISMIKPVALAGVPDERQKRAEQEQPARVGRRLAAIVAADVAGYSRLMGLDEVGTARTLREHRAVTDALVAKHGGRLVKSTGDGVLLEFPSVVDAVECAVAVQAVMAERNEGVPVDRRMLFRIGINLGDILIEGDDILGDGVNVAARLEGIAEPGGICISSSAYDQVRGKVAVEFTDLGEQNLKNIARPVRAYAVGRDDASTLIESRPAAIFSPASVHRGAAVRKHRRRSRARVLRRWGDREPDHGLVAHQLVRS